MVRMLLVGIPDVALFGMGIAGLLLGLMPHSEGTWAILATYAVMRAVRASYVRAAAKPPPPGH